MSTIATSRKLPDHTQLPETDGAIVENFQEHPQSILITESLRPILQQRHPDNQYCIGQNSGIYWRITEPPLDGCKAPDWFYVPGVPPGLAGKPRRSYVLWQEFIAPFLIMEFVSGNGDEERDATPYEGKFWVYESGIRAPYYAIYEVDPGQVELYRLEAGRYRRVAANERGHFSIPELGIELGIWQGTYMNFDLPWLRVWDLEGNLLLLGEERADQEQKRADEQHERAERFAAILRAQGIDPDQL